MYRCYYMPGTQHRFSHLINTHNTTTAEDHYSHFAETLTYLPKAKQQVREWMNTAHVFLSFHQLVSWLVCSSHGNWASTQFLRPVSLPGLPPTSQFSAPALGTCNYPSSTITTRPKISVHCPKHLRHPCLSY